MRRRNFILSVPALALAGCEASEIIPSVLGDYAPDGAILTELDVPATPVTWYGRREFRVSDAEVAALVRAEVLVRFTSRADGSGLPITMKIEPEQVRFAVSPGGATTFLATVSITDATNGVLLIGPWLEGGLTISRELRVDPETAFRAAVTHFAERISIGLRK